MNPSDGKLEEGRTGGEEDHLIAWTYNSPYTPAKDLLTSARTQLSDHDCEPEDQVWTRNESVPNGVDIIGPRYRPLRMDPRLKGFTEEIELNSVGGGAASIASEFRFFTDRNSLLSEFNGVLKLLRFLGLYPAPILNPRSHSKTTYLKLALIGSIVGMIASVALLGFNIHIVIEMTKEQPILHINPMTQILNGMKPLQTLINLIVFSIGLELHDRLLIAFGSTDSWFQEYLSLRPPLKRYKIEIYVAFLISAIIPISLRACQYGLNGEKPGDNIIADGSLFFLPFFCIWQILPLMYFVTFTRILTFWFRSLHKEMKRDFNLGRRTIAFYYKSYLQLTQCSMDLGAFFNPYIFFSLGNTVVILCLTIYFFVHVKQVFDSGPSTHREKIISLFVPIWAGTQIFISLAHVLCISIAGMRTNERARAILSVILTMIPSDETSRFQLICFTNKIHSQHQWGISVWRAFPMERSLLLTLISGILTYTVILIKLQQYSVQTFVTESNLTLS